MLMHRVGSDMKFALRRSLVFTLSLAIAIYDVFYIVHRLSADFLFSLAVVTALPVMSCQ